MNTSTRRSYLELDIIHRIGDHTADFWAQRNTADTARHTEIQRDTAGTARHSEILSGHCGYIEILRTLRIQRDTAGAARHSEILRAERKLRIQRDATDTKGHCEILRDSGIQRYTARYHERTQDTRSPKCERGDKLWIQAARTCQILDTEDTGSQERCITFWIQAAKSVRRMTIQTTSN